MNTYLLRWAIFLLWVFFAALMAMMLTLDRVGWLARWDDDILRFALGFSLLLAGWNGFRLFFPRRRRAVPPVEAPKPVERPFEYNPELDFFKPETPAK